MRVNLSRLSSLPEPASITRGLRPLDLSGPGLDGQVLSAAEQDYLNFYGLDFSSNFPLVRYHLGCIESGSDQLAVQVWCQPGASSTVLLVHGYFDHVGLFGHLVRFGLGRGSNVVAYDLPGHGLSSGAPAMIEDFSQYTQSISDVLTATASLPGLRHVIAQSTGGAAVMDYLTVNGQQPWQGMVLLAPLVRPLGWRRTRWAQVLLRRFVQDVPRRFADNSGDRAFLEFLRNDPLQPRRIPLGWIVALRRWLPLFLQRAPVPCKMLVLQGDKDGTVDWPYNMTQVSRLFPGARIEMIAGARHHLANETAAIRSNYLRQVESYLRSMEC